MAMTISEDEAAARREALDQAIACRSQIEGNSATLTRAELFFSFLTGQKDDEESVLPEGPTVSPQAREFANRLRGWTMTRDEANHIIATVRACIR